MNQWYYFLYCPTAAPKLPESTAVKEDMEVEDEVAPNPPLKDDMDAAEVKVETPELKVP